MIKHINSPKLRDALLKAGSLPDKYCKSLDSGYYPSWIDSAPPTNLCCTHAIKNPRNGDVCHSFRECSSTGVSPKPLQKPPQNKNPAKTAGMHKVSSKGGGKK